MCQTAYSHGCDCITVRMCKALATLHSSSADGRSGLTWGTNGAFPWPQTTLKQLKEWHFIVSCDQLGEILRTAPTLPLTRKSCWILGIEDKSNSWIRHEYVTNNPHLCEIWSVFTVSRTLKVVTFYFLIPHINGFPPGQLTAYHSRQILANRVVFIVSEFARLRQIFSPLLRFPGQLRWPVQRSRTMSDSVLIVSRQAFFMEFFKSCKIKISRYASQGHWAKKKYDTSAEFMLMLSFACRDGFQCPFVPTKEKK